MANAKATAEKPVETPAEAESFELDAELLEVIKPSSGRKPVDSIYLPDVKLAIESGKARGVKIPADRKGTQVVSELHKAAKQLGIKVQTWNKESDERRFVAFRVKTAPAEPATETTSIPVVPAATAE